MTAIFPDAEGVDLEPPLTRLLGAAPWRAVLGVRLALLVAQIAPLFVLRRTAPLSRLAAADRARVMGALLASPFYAVRQLALLLKMLGAFVVGCMPDVRAELVPGRAIPVPLESGPRLVDARSLTRPAAGGADGRRSA